MSVNFMEIVVKHPPKTVVLYVNMIYAFNFHQSLNPVNLKDIRYMFAYITKCGANWSRATPGWEKYGIFVNLMVSDVED